MSRYIANIMNLKMPKRFIIWDRGSSKIASRKGFTGLSPCCFLPHQSRIDLLCTDVRWAPQQAICDEHPHVHICSDHTYLILYRTKSPG